MMKELFPIPTGYLFTDYYDKGELETLSIGDYGKEYNIKSDFLGYDREINGVPNIKIKPLSEKWVITLSTQYGCSMRCNFCDVPKVGPGINVSFNDMWNQFINAINLYPNIKYTDRLNVHLARMGEPTFNNEIFKFIKELSNKKKIYDETGLRIEVIHPVLSTMMPNKNKDLFDFIESWCLVKNVDFNGQAGLQLSINSTNEEQRNVMFGDTQTELSNVSEFCNSLPEPLGRKYCLNFAYADEFEIDGNKLANLFDNKKFMCKITPIHNTNTSKQNNIKTLNGYNSYHPYKKIEENLKNNGFDVIVFIPSLDEEENFVTCGNAILSGDGLMKKDACK